MGDLFFTTDNPILLKHTENLPAIFCIQRKATKVVPTEEAIIQSNKDSFGDAIGSITNVITSQICLQARFPKESQEYKTLDYRILCGQMFQQNAIDKAKGIVAKPMPRWWHDSAANKIYDEDSKEVIEKKLFNQRICADKKPYFFIYNYPSLLKEYNTYIKDANKTCYREYGITLDELLSLEDPTDAQRELISFYNKLYPVNKETCLVNEICYAVEESFSNPKKVTEEFDYTVLKSPATYTSKQKYAIMPIYDKYIKLIKSEMSHGSGELDYSSIQEQFKIQCLEQVPDESILCNILLDIGYTSNRSKAFIWDICGDVIIDNLLSRTDGYGFVPVKDPSGDISYCGEKFSMQKIYIRGDANGNTFE